MVRTQCIVSIGNRKRTWKRANKVKRQSEFIHIEFGNGNRRWRLANWFRKETALATVGLHNATSKSYVCTGLV